MLENEISTRVVIKYQIERFLTPIFRIKCFEKTRKRTIRENMISPKRTRMLLDLDLFTSELITWPILLASLGYPLDLVTTLFFSHRDLLPHSSLEKCNKITDEGWALHNIQALHKEKRMFLQKDLLFGILMKVFMLTDERRQKIEWCRKKVFDFLLFRCNLKECSYNVSREVSKRRWVDEEQEWRFFFMNLLYLDRSLLPGDIICGGCWVFLLAAE